MQTRGVGYDVAVVRGPEVVVIGAMKCGTSAVHTYLDAHPEIAMAPGKELNFFFGPEEPPPVPAEDWWLTGQWHRGLHWYADQLDPASPVRGESSPGYTDPSHPEVPERMAAVVPSARLVYLVRDPVDRAVSQWRHHVRDGTEPREVSDAILDPQSQYVARSRFHERVEPFLPHYRDQLLVVALEDLRDRPRQVMSRLYEHVGVDPSFWHPSLKVPVHTGDDQPAEVSRKARAEFLDRVCDDQERLADLLERTASA